MNYEFMYYELPFKDEAHFNAVVEDFSNYLRNPEPGGAHYCNLQANIEEMDHAITDLDRMIAALTDRIGDKWGFHAWQSGKTRAFPVIASNGGPTDKAWLSVIARRKQAT